MTAKSENLLNNTVFFFFALFLFSSSLSVAISQCFLGVSLLLFVVQIIVSRYNPIPKSLFAFYLFIILYLVWMVLTSLIDNSELKHLEREWLFCIIPLGIFLFKRGRYRWLLIYSLSLGMLLASLYGIFQHSTGANWFKSFPLTMARDDTFYAAGGFGSNMIYGNYLATGSVFVIALAVLKNKIWKEFRDWNLLTTGVMGIVGTIMSYSRMGLAALLGGIVAVAWLKSRRWLLATVLLSSIAIIPTLFLFPQLALKFELAFKEDLAGDTQSSRFFIWQKSLEMAGDNLIFGIGRGNFDEVYVSYLDPAKNETKSRPHAHNDLLNFAVISGIPGAAIYVSIWVIWYRLLFRIRRTSDPSTDQKLFSSAAGVAGFVFLLTSLTEATFLANVAVRQLLMVIWAAGLWPLMSKKNDADMPEIESA